MPNLAANLSMMFQEWPFLERFAAAADAGFKGVEFLFPYDFEPEEIARRLRRAGLQQVLFNLPPGDFARGERGLAALPGREAEFAAALEQAIGYARKLQCPRLHVMAGLMPAGVPAERLNETYRANLSRAAERAGREGLTLLIEPINRRDIPGYFLSDYAYARAVIEAIGSPALRLQFDVYHAQIIGGDLAHAIARDLDLTAHVQVANPPDRQEPDQGEIHYDFIFDLFDRLGYEGWIGCEYRPKAGTLEGLGWGRRYGLSAASAAARPSR